MRIHTAGVCPSCLGWKGPPGYATGCATRLKVKKIKTSFLTSLRLSCNGCTAKPKVVTNIRAMPEAEANEIRLSMSNDIRLLVFMYFLREKVLRIAVKFWTPARYFAC